DKVAEGTEDWTKILGAFWKPFESNVEEKTKSVEKVNMTQELDRTCPTCNERNLVIRHGRFGKFIACPGFPDCKYTEQLKAKTGVQCPECNQGELVEKRTRRGKTFWSCERYPDCKYATWDNPLKAKKTGEGEESSDEKSVDAAPSE